MPPSRSKHIASEFDNTQRHRALYQLRDILDLNETLFEEVKAKFEEVTRRHMDIEKVGSSQTHALDMAIEDLKPQFPALFNGGNVVRRFVRTIILVIHNNRRKQWIRKKRTLTSMEKENPPSSAKPRPSLAERMAANLLSITNGKAPAPRIFASPAPQIVQSSPSKSEMPSGSFASQQRFPGLLSQTPNLTPTTSSNNVVAGLSTSTLCGDMAGCVRPSRGGQIRSVHKFLEAAIPPMTHLLHRFIEFGCLGEYFLFAVSLWPTERIRTFLMSLPPGPRGKEITKMEVEVLVYHFESYFLGSNSKA